MSTLLLLPRNQDLFYPFVLVQSYFPVKVKKTHILCSVLSFTTFFLPPAQTNSVGNGSFRKVIKPLSATGNPFTINARLQVCRKYLQFFIQHFCQIRQKVKELSGSVKVRALKFAQKVFMVYNSKIFGLDIQYVVCVAYKHFPPTPSNQPFDCLSCVSLFASKMLRDIITT